MIQKTKVLITDPNYKHSLGILYALTRAGYAVDVISDNVSLLIFSRYITKAPFLENNFKEQSIELFLDFLKKADYDVFLPVGAKSIYLASKYKSEIEKYVKTPLANFEKISFCMDKEKIKQASTSIGLDVAEHWPFASKKELIDQLEGFSYPVVIKGRNEIFKNHPQYADDPSDLLNKINILERIVGEDIFEQIIIEKKILGRGYGFFALYNSGKCIQYFMHKRIREFPPTGGSSTCAESVCDEGLLNSGRTILDFLQWHGVAMVEFKKDEETGKNYVIEINPKFWGSLDLAIECGVDFPTLAVQMALGEKIKTNNQYYVGLKYHWPINGELMHAFFRPKSIPIIFRDFINPNVKNNLILKDPLVIIFSFFSELRSIIFYLKSIVFKK